MKLVNSLLVSLCVAGVASQEPVPDTSEDCNECKNTLDELQIKWNNETTVDEIVSFLWKPFIILFGDNCMLNTVCYRLPIFTISA
jgi:hypothetical protein